MRLSKTQQKLYKFIFENGYIIRQAAKWYSPTLKKTPLQNTSTHLNSLRDMGVVTFVDVDKATLTDYGKEYYIRNLED